jgi:predicted transcriptional regulator
MKTAVMPPLRVKPELRLLAESVLHPDESLSSFMFDALNHQIAHRRAQTDFLARGLASAELAAKNGEYVPASAVLEKLKAKLTEAKIAQTLVPANRT